VIDFCPPELLTVFFRRHSPRFQREHEDELRQLHAITEPPHVQQSSLGKTYRDGNNKYRLTLSSMAWASLIQFLESKQDQGGVTIQDLIKSHVHIVTAERTAIASDRSLAAMLARSGDDFDIPAEDEGIPGHNPGSANTDRNAPGVLPNLKLGQMPMDPDAMEDIRAELKEEDDRHPPATGEPSLLDEFEQRIKQEPGDDAPSRELIPLPPPLARDIKSEVGKIREYRDRFKIDPKTSGVGPGVSVCMYTFHNTHDKYVNVTTRLSLTG
jgi:transcription initiation factor TFIID subunit 5